MRNKYRYQRLKLNEIRLLELHDLPDKLRLIRRIFSVSRAECPPYTAISYTWGADERLPPETIVCDDPDSYINVTKNLESALRSVVRSRTSGSSTTGQDEDGDRGLFVWVDAISINQTDAEEKNRHVGTMHEIYQRAKDVHIWLGDGDKDTGKAFDLIGTLVTTSQQYHQPSQYPWPLGNMCCQIRPQSFGMNSVDDFNQASDALVALLKRPWFTRIWIVQEVAASQSAGVFCGDRSVDWDDLVKAVTVSLSIKLRPSETFGRKQMLRIAQTREEYQAKSAGDGLGNEMEHLQRLLFRHHDFSSTIPHDMIYALRGVSGLPTIYEEHQRFVESLMSGKIEIPSVVDWNDLTEQVDYRKSMEEVYTEVASKILSECQSLDLLGACTWPRQSDTLPSWVPDWSTSGTHSPLRQQLELLRTKFSVMFSASAKYTQCDIRFYDEEGEAAETFDSNIIRYLGLSGFTLDVIKTVLLSPDDTRVNGLREMFVLLRSEHWKLATTRGDVVCVVTIEAQEGDEIGLFQGGKTPLILRKSNDDIDVTNEREYQVTIWKLIGECYVDGIMDGSMFDISKCSAFWIS